MKNFTVEIKIGGVAVLFERVEAKSNVKATSSVLARFAVEESEAHKPITVIARESATEESKPCWCRHVSHPLCPTHGDPVEAVEAAA